MWGLYFLFFIFIVVLWVVFCDNLVSLFSVFGVFVGEVKSILGLFYNFVVLRVREKGLFISWLSLYINVLCCWWFILFKKLSVMWKFVVGIVYGCVGFWLLVCL